MGDILQRALFPVLLANELRCGSGLSDVSDVCCWPACLLANGMEGSLSGWMGEWCRATHTHTHTNKPLFESPTVTLS